MGDQTRRTKVAYFVPPSSHFAGVERVVHEIAGGLAEAHGDALDIHVVFTSRYDEDVLHSVPYTTHVLGASRLRHLLGALRRCAAAERFDVLVCPQIEASVVAWVATRGLRLPVFISHLHGNPRVEESGGSRRTRAAFLFFRWFVRPRVSAVLAVSPSLQRHAAAGIARGARVIYVPNPVRRTDDGRPRPERRDASFRFVSVARLSRQKGQDLLLEAFAAALPRMPGALLSLVGSGPDEVFLRELAADLSIAGSVTFRGYVTEPGQILEASDCFVLPSRWEGFGLVLVEALGAGLPVVAADCEFGPADVITDHRLGELVPPEDVGALSEGLVRAYSRTSSPEDVAHRRAVARTFSSEAVTPLHYAVLEQVVRNRPRHSRSLGLLDTA